MPLIGHQGHRELVETWKPGGLIHNTIHDQNVSAIVVVSAHHDSDDNVAVMTDQRPELLFDYGGFPPETYQYSMANPGSPELASEILELLQQAGIPCHAESKRGRDHGVFVPLLGLEISQRPSLPIVSVSLRGPAFYDTGVEKLTKAHWELGKALAPLRQKGVLLLGSGNTIHSRHPTAEEALAFDEHLRALGEEQASGEGKRDLRDWAAHQAAFKCCGHGPEHLLPLIVMAGAATEGGAVESLPHRFMGQYASHFLFH